MGGNENFDAFRENMMSPLGHPRADTKKEFLALPENRKLRSNIRSVGIICYFCAAITAAAGYFLLDAGEFILLDVAILLGLGLGVHLGHSKVCAIVLLLYALVSAVLTCIDSGTFSGWLVILAGIYAVISTFRLDKQWKAYREQGL